MLHKIIEVERDYSPTSLCEICFNTTQKSNIYKLHLGFENNGIINEKTKLICSYCLNELKNKLENIY